MRQPIMYRSTMSVSTLRLPATVYRMQRRHAFVGVLFALWLALAFVVRLYSQIILHGADDSVVISIVSVVWPPLLLMLLGHSVIPRGIDLTTLTMLGVFVLFATLSCFVSPIPLISIGFLAATLAGIYVAMLFSGILTADDVKLGLKIYAVLIVVLLFAYATYDHRNFEGYRLGEGTGSLNPNALGMIAMSGVASAFAFRFGIIRIALVLGAGWNIYASGSRAAAVAALIAIAAVSWNDFWRSKLIVKLVIIVPAIATLIWYVSSHWDIVYLQLDAFFQWDDHHRGISSGGSGRTHIWAAMWEIIRENLLVGVGYRAHTEFIKIATSAHNGYLAMFAEVGIFGFTAIILLTLRRLIAIFRRFISTKDPVMAIYAGFFLGFLVLAMFERYFLNIGNPASLLFLFVLFGCLPSGKKRKLNTQGGVKTL